MTIIINKFLNVIGTYLKSNIILVYVDHTHTHTHTCTHKHRDMA